MTNEQMIERLQTIRKNYTGEDDEALMWAIECIRHVPKQGEWKYKRNGIFCPICDKGWEYCKVPSDLQEYNFCPNCGARMKEGDEK